VSNLANLNESFEVRVILKVTRVAELKVEGVWAEFERTYNVKVQV